MSVERSLSPVPTLSNVITRGEAGQSFEPRGRGSPALRIEGPVEVRDKSRNEHYVDRTVADHREGDVQITPAGIVDLGSHIDILTQTDLHFTWDRRGWPR